MKNSRGGQLIKWWAKTTNRDGEIVYQPHYWDGQVGQGLKRRPVAAKGKRLRDYTESGPYFKYRLKEVNILDDQPDECEKCGGEVVNKLVGDEIYRWCPDCGFSIQQ